MRQSLEMKNVSDNLRVFFLRWRSLFPAWVYSD